MQISVRVAGTGVEVERHDTSRWPVGNSCMLIER